MTRTILAATDSMNISSISRRARGIAGATVLALAPVAIAACGDRDNRYAAEGDTGAPAPATVNDKSSVIRPDSTLGVSNPTGAPQTAAGDTMGSRARDSTKGPTAGKPVGRP